MKIIVLHRNVSSIRQEATSMRKPRCGNEEEQRIVNEARRRQTRRRQISAAEPREQIVVLLLVAKVIMNEGIVQNAYVLYFHF